MKAEEELIQRRAENQRLRAQVEQLNEHVSQRDERMEQVVQRVNEWERRLAKDSHNRSLPPSSDRFARKTKARSLRKSSGKKTGGQAGHPGTTLSMSERPDAVITLSVTTCQHCQADLAAMAASNIEHRQVGDVPPTACPDHRRPSR